jgi:hypothetical protein
MEIESYRVVSLITEEEMWQLRNDKPDEKGVPQFYCVTRGGGVQFFPRIDPSKCKLMCAEGVI